jgi:Sec7-like guanine-nucleotide exchange factor
MQALKALKADDERKALPAFLLSECYAEYKKQTLVFSESCGIVSQASQDLIREIREARSSFNPFKRLRLRKLWSAHDKVCDAWNYILRQQEDRHRMMEVTRDTYEELIRLHSHGYTLE